MKRVFKYPIPITAEFAVDVSMPQGARVLSVGTQNDQLVVWALVDSTANMRPVTFKVVGTGWNIEETAFDGFEFLGTAQMQGDELFPVLVWHVWVAR